MLAVNAPNVPEHRQNVSQPIASFLYEIKWPMMYRKQPRRYFLPIEKVPNRYTNAICT
jgi:hypothetical protein